jgi:hypothetical protein
MLTIAMRSRALRGGPKGAPLGPRTSSLASSMVVAADACR